VTLTLWLAGLTALTAFAWFIARGRRERSADTI
jgi:hypothetical protein